MLPFPAPLISSHQRSKPKLSPEHSKATQQPAGSIPIDPGALNSGARAMAAGKAALRKPSFGTRAWRLLQLAVFWARRGSAAHSLRFLRTLRRRGLGGARVDRLRYGEREFSIDETPAFRFRTPSARVLRLIPCIAPAVPDTPGLYDDGRYFFCAAREREEVVDAGYHYGADQGSGCEDDEESSADQEQLLERAMAEEGGGDAGVDVKAEEFIARFYAQMKLQRQISWLQYNEMMERSIS
ncbi:uncharacterized protein LOC133916269 [Phragmites australis]|uniref:uncharacterized protein LOC133916269 n=1 Tax=Phragmites australis TaxID=29695 RepID=UPI002D79917D|nr:uncharacterized protein LOC133916269 [Phragmites australis]